MINNINNLFFFFNSATSTPGYPRPSLIPSRDGPLGLHHPDILGRPYADQLAHQVMTINVLKRNHCRNEIYQF